MNRYEMCALGQFLVEYPTNKTYDEVLDLIESGDESIGIWEPFENHNASFVIKCIEDLKCSVEHYFPGAIL